jgi:hypothetical protein
VFLCSAPSKDRPSALASSTNSIDQASDEAEQCIAMAGAILREGDYGHDSSTEDPLAPVDPSFVQQTALYVVASL